MKVRKLEPANCHYELKFASDGLVVIVRGPEGAEVIRSLVQFDETRVTGFNAVELMTVLLSDLVLRPAKTRGAFKRAASVGDRPPIPRLGALS